MKTSIGITAASQAKHFVVAAMIICTHIQTAQAQNAPLLIPSAPAKSAPSKPAASPETQLGSTTSESQKLTPAATEFIKGLALILLPPTFTDDDDWGNTKRIQSGLNMKLDGFELKTSRRWKDVKHGLWRRVDATLIDPLKFFDLQIWLLPKTNDNQPRYRISAHLRIAITVRQQQWNRGLKVYSVSSDILTDVSVDTVIDFRSKLVNIESKQRLQILPHIQTANVSIDRFLIRRISHAKGGAVKEFGSLFEGLVRKVVEKKSQKLPQKINSKIEKKADRFQFSGTMLNVFGIKAKTDEDDKTK
ncbi:MAG: hypothetical protein ABJZ55_19695 [Fuerstiella sp.]